MTHRAPSPAPHAAPNGRAFIRRPSGPRASAPRAFTLVELLVVIGIIGVLAAILVPMLARSRRQASRTIQAQTFQTITTALEAYKTDNGGRYPQVVAQDGGAKALFAAVGAERQGIDTIDSNGDGNPTNDTEADAPKIPPYIKPGSIKSDASVFFDSWDKPILYYNSNPVTDVRTTNAARYAAQAAYLPGTQNLPRWNINDNVTVIAPERFKKMIGDANADGIIGAGEEPINVPFILWSAGPDSIYTPVGGLSKEEIEKCDDVVNFK